MKKGDIVIILLTVILAFFLSNIFVKDKASFNELQIIQDGKIIERYAVDKNLSKTVNITNGDFKNIIEIKDGKIRMISANCPDKLCVKSHEISKNGEMIVCLPHRLYVKLVNAEEENGLDIISS